MVTVREGLYPEHSITRRVNRENVLFLSGGRALLMQLAHPSVAAGVDEHSDFREHPLRRLRRTIVLLMAMVFGDRETALTAARSVNRTHARVRGEGYHALDPDLLLWVHATLIDSAVEAYHTFVQPLSRPEREELWHEWKLVGELLGIPRGHAPDRLSDFDRYMEHVQTHVLRVDARARTLAGLVLRPPVRLLPGIAMLPLEIITTGLLPPRLREQYGLRWGTAQRGAYRVAVAAVPKLVAITPPVLRVWPLPGRNVELPARSIS
jgi:uncharacterized protein (DUF2236 family)